MGLQLIFTVECDSKSQTDWMYIKSTIEHFYHYDRGDIKLTPIYLSGKGNYQKKKSEIDMF